MNLLSSLMYCIKCGLEYPSQIGRRATGLSRACNALGLEEAALHGGATEAPTSRRWEWRGKSTFCRPKDISKHICVLAQPVLICHFLIGLECGQSKRTSTAWIPPYNKWPQWKKAHQLLLSLQGREHVCGRAPREDGAFRGTIWWKCRRRIWLRMSVTLLWEWILKKSSFSFKDFF